MTSEIVIAPGRIGDAPDIKAAREAMRKARPQPDSTDTKKS